jgi:periplasmic divalent cation tolerance protein
MLTMRDQTAADPLRTLLILTTWPEDHDAATLAAPLVEEGLAACVNVLPPMVSVYRWQGSVQREAERQILIKTTAARLPDLKARLRTLHPYEVPEVLVIEVAAGSAAYLDWVAASTRSV